MAKSKLLEEAIADAKAVRETALENARAVLEEAFAPKLQSILSKKLQQEMEQEDLDEFENIEASGTNVGKTNDAPHPLGLTDDDEIMNEGESGYKADDHTVDPQGPSKELSAGPTDQDSVSTHNKNTSSEGPKAGAKLTTSHTDHSDVKAGNNRAASDQDTNETPNVNTASELTISEGEDDLAAIIAELDSELDLDSEDDVSFGDEDLEGDVEISDELPGDELPGEEAEVDVDLGLGDEVEGEESVGDDIPADNVAGDEAEEDEEIDLDEILREMELGDEPAVASDEMIQELKTLREENAEYKKAFGYLKTKLNEVNLLNAKLLFTNKVFKSYGLNNSQKMKVVEAFDRAKNTREVKLTYANLRESFDIFNSKKSSITEGIASKTVKSTKPSEKTVEKQKKILSEGNELAARFKKLAGIK